MITPEQEGARLFHAGCMFSSLFHDVDERFVHCMKLMERVGDGYIQARQAYCETQPKKI